MTWVGFASTWLPKWTTKWRRKSLAKESLGIHGPLFLLRVFETFAARASRRKLFSSIVHFHERHRGNHLAVVSRLTSSPGRSIDGRSCPIPRNTNGVSCTDLQHGITTCNTESRCFCRWRSGHMLRGRCLKVSISSLIGCCKSRMFCLR